MLDLELGPGRLGPLGWERVELRRVLGEQRLPGLEIQITGLQPAEWLPPGNLDLGCRQLDWQVEGVVCRDGRLSLPESWLALDGDLELVVVSLSEAGYRVKLDHPQLRGQLQWTANTGFELVLERLDFEAVRPLLEEIPAISALGGQLAGTVRVDGAGSVQGELIMEELFFDTADGRMAGEGINLTLDLAAPSDGAPLQLSVEQSAGELLLGPVYLPPPDEPLSLETALDLAESGTVKIVSLQFNDPGSISLSGHAEMAASESGWQLSALGIETLKGDLGRLWRRWIEGPAAAVGFPDLAARGQIHGSLDWSDGTIESVDLRSEGVGLKDPRGRAGIEALNAVVSGGHEAVRIELDWDGMELLGLALGGGSARLHHDEVGLRLLDPVRMALLDGALVIDGLAVLQAPELASRLVLDARIEPVDLARLTRALELPELGGQLAGRFPGVTLSEQRLAFTGGIDIDAFSGHIAIDELVVERLFGSVPALSAQVELERLDLLELTGAFGFGRMEGEASGWVHDLRLLNWRPAAMNARLFTHEDAPSRRISQRAVDNLASLGGGGSAVISGTVLRLFEDFPYRRAGLACRLANNICQMDGVAPHESGGFLIVEGRGLPRLDIVGHRRLVDWPQLMGQLASVIE